MKSHGLALLSLLFAASAQAAIITENFDDVTALTGNGWVMTNRSNPVGSTGWFQGNDGVFDAYSGASDSYIAANFENSNGGALSNWLITPVLSLVNGTVVTFYTRTDDSSWQDALEVRFNPLGTTNVGATAASVGDFSLLLLAINPTADGSYPEAWTRQTAVVTGAGTPVSGRLAFRYAVADTSAAGSYIGIDSVSVDAGVPEPGSVLLAATGLLLAAGYRVSSRRK